MSLLRERINPDLENDIITAFITSTHFLEKTHKWYKPHYFSDYGRIITNWVMDYWNKYREAPGRNIQNIYNVKQEEIPQALAQNISTYLANLSSNYESRSEFNLPFMVDETRVFFKRRAFEHLFTHGRELIMAGQIDDAQRLHEEFRGVANQVSKWENPFDQTTIKSHFAEHEDNSHIVFNYRGALGKLLGPQERGWLVAWLGPMKRGKSFWIQESMFAGASNRKNVAYINLEMINKGVRDREYKRLTGLSEQGGNIRFPLVDCYWNQLGECPVPHLRENDVPLRYENGNKPIWGTPGYDDYQVCTACRNNPDVQKHFNFDTWFTTYEQKREYDQKEVSKMGNQFIRQFGDRIRQKTYPAYSVTIEEIQSDLWDLAYTDKFHPDIVLIDYADIVAAKHDTGNERQHLNQVWKAMKRAAGEMQNIWITGSQTNRAAIKSTTIGQVDTAEDIRKVAHVDAMYGINQKDDEKEDLITRINVIAHRHRKFGKRQVTVLNQLEIGLPYIDSEWSKPEPEIKKHR